MPKRIFISHSSPMPGDRDFVLRLADELERNRHYSALLDRKDLQSSDVWARKLHDWLAWCQAGVILLTTESIKKPWVLKEATILAWRQAQDRGFRLFPAVFPGVDAAALEAERFGPLVLDQVQFVKGTEPADIANEIAGVLGTDEGGTTPLDRLVDTLADILEGHAGQQELRAIGAKLGIKADEWTPGESDVERLCGRMARQVVRDDLGSYQGIDQLINDLGSLSDEYARKVLDLVAPYWVPAEDAGRLTDALNRPGRWSLAMNGRRIPRFTSRMYVGRAFPSDRFNRVLPLRGGDSDRMVEETIVEIGVEIRRHCCLEAPSAEALREFLETTRFRFYVPVPRALHDEKALALLKGAFPSSVVFILHPGKAWGSGEALTERAGEALSVIDIDLEREDQAYKHYRDAAIALGGAGADLMAS